jgi:hypothetical protein
VFWLRGKITHHTFKNVLVPSIITEESWEISSNICHSIILKQITIRLSYSAKPTDFTLKTIIQKSKKKIT